MKQKLAPKRYGWHSNEKQNPDLAVSKHQNIYSPDHGLNSLIDDQVIIYVWIDFNSM